MTTDDFMDKIESMPLTPEEIKDRDWIILAREKASEIKTSDQVAALQKEWQDKSNNGHTRLAFAQYAGLEWIDIEGWEETGLWPPPRRFFVCICCEKELEPVSYTSTAQPYDGGEVAVSFHYGSRYDHIGFTQPVIDPPYTEHDLGPEIGVVRSGQLVTTEPYPGVMDLPERENRLAACHAVLGVICDDCFQKKAPLFKGYMRNPETKKLTLVVE